ncbi:hypothetical protein [Actinomycetospora termitidis]|uniref:Uncharacterized protein n=1 Tax=Actinomycetospora termitidis TaxID=3053470 RepID=A0ABT7M6T6_9PSEU|nr:hypothetical protein [Actinomycetospora sp. Odt1-22]MDL5156384.1 hypothetical protein [Actinomycetospora sp. Odt1-22]
MILELVGWVVLRERVWPPFLVLIGFSIFGFWWLFAMPTYCDHMTNSGRACIRPVHGKFRGCSYHARAKRDAVFSLFSLTNPGRNLRLVWQGRDSPSGTNPSKPAHQATRRDAYDGIMLAATVGSFLTGTAGAVFGGLALL